MTNSANMSAAERLALKLRSSPMSELLDEDDIIQIAGDAIKQAFFKPIPGDYGRMSDPLIVTHAREVFAEVMRDHIATAVKGIAETPEFRQAITDAAVAAIPALILTAGRAVVTQSVEIQAAQTLTMMQDMLRQRLGS